MGVDERHRYTVLLQDGALVALVPDLVVQLDVLPELRCPRGPDDGFPSGHQLLRVILIDCVGVEVCGARRLYDEPAEEAVVDEVAEARAGVHVVRPLECLVDRNVVGVLRAVSGGRV
ncbi:MAG: hypothetical protein ABJA81_04365 [Nocardioidaceae bacterium]